MERQRNERLFKVRHRIIKLLSIYKNVVSGSGKFFDAAASSLCFRFRNLGCLEVVNVLPLPLLASASATKNLNGQRESEIGRVQRESAGARERDSQR